MFLGDRLLAAKVGTRPVHGRSAAGGQSQQRFARRREGQARVLFTAAADNAVRVLLPHADALDAVVLGGDRWLLGELRADPRLARLQDKIAPWVLDVPDPRQRILEQTPARFRTVRVTEWVTTEPTN